MKEGNPLRIYNTLTGRKETFIPQNPPEVKMYTCGVTVYDHCHLGHGRSLYVFEIIRKYLQYKGFKVKFVRNITDVDDKIINKARQWRKEKKIDRNPDLMSVVRSVAKTYIKSYREDRDNLGISSADEEPQAIDNIPEMGQFIQELIRKNFAYEIEGNIYFSVREFPAYGKLSGRKIDELLEGVRKEVDPLKKEPFDFALWKVQKKDEPSWESNVGQGRPGWHIECSVMARKYLGDTLDIHGGGRDLVFPHHENEIAQSESLTGKPFARYWIHHGLLTINGQKMAKSLGNFITLKDAIKRYSPDVLKILYLSAHYRSSLDFSDKKINEVETVAGRITTFIKQLKSRLKIRPGTESIPLKNSDFSHREFKELHRKFEESMDDDFNMPAGFSAVFDVIRIVNENLERERSFFAEAKGLLYEILDMFSLFKDERSAGEKEIFEGLNEKNIEEKIARRNQLRAEKKYKEADIVREKLLNKGIVLEDVPGGKTIWYRK
ncbi:MAG: cysteine--tRNA ligase [Candidatus Omnitrophica bacterium]|nr:cysteine--tRNA ligase [Candidatus Omnitrophota bacterium]